MKAKGRRHNHRAQPRQSATLSDYFAAFAQATSHWAGHPTAFLLALMAVAVWIVSGPLFGFTDTWQLVINTGTTIVTFLMVFLIQNQQNRDSIAIQLKLSELVLAMKGAENKFAAVEDLSDEELEKLHDECRARADMTLAHIERRQGRPRDAGRRVRAAAHRASMASRKSRRTRKS